MFNITNYSEHPNNSNYTVFRFYEQRRAEYFETLLSEREIWNESTIDLENGKTTYLFGIKKSDFEAANHCNFLVNGKYRKPSIPNVYGRWLLIGITVFLVALSIIGYLRR